MRTILYLAAVAAIVVFGNQMGADRAQAAPQAKPTLSSDVHDNPVYTSPTNQLTVAHWAQSNTLPVVPPALTNWPVTNLPPSTNWPTTNSSPALTNPPPLTPGHR